jgi:hypothetical protein
MNEEQKCMIIVSSGRQLHLTFIIRGRKQTTTTTTTTTTITTTIIIIIIIIIIPRVVNGE